MQRGRDVRGRRAVDEHREQREIVGLDAMRGGVELLARIAGADGIVDKAAPAVELFEAIRLVARGETALPPLTREALDAAAHRVEPDDLALLAMLVDRTSPADVAATLHMDRRRVAKRTERVLGRLRGSGSARPAPRAAA